jgi:hypothetical protein
MESNILYILRVHQIHTQGDIRDFISGMPGTSGNLGTISGTWGYQELELKDARYFGYIRYMGICVM